MSGTFDSVAFVRIDWCSCRVNQLPCDYFPSGCQTGKTVSYYLLKSYIILCWYFICFRNNELYGFKMKRWNEKMEFKWKHFNFYFKKLQNKQDTHLNTLPVMSHDAIIVTAILPHYDVIMSFERDLVHFRFDFLLQLIYSLTSQCGGMHSTVIFSETLKDIKMSCKRK